MSMSEEQIADMEHLANMRGLHIDAQHTIRALAAEVRRLREDNFRDAIKGDHLRNVLEGERDEARAALARAVELLRAMMTKTDSAATFADVFSAVTGFLAEHGGK